MAPWIGASSLHAQSAAAPPAPSRAPAAAPAGMPSPGVAAPGGPGGKSGVDLGQLKNTLVQSAAEAGMQALAREITGASESQVE